jgi:hypothetical protein
MDFDREQSVAKRTLDDVREEDANRAFVPQKQNFAPLGFVSLAQHYDAWGLQQQQQQQQPPPQPYGPPTCALPPDDDDDSI